MNSLPTRLLTALACAAAFLLGAGVEALETRTWTRADGTKTFEGKLRSYDSKRGIVSVIRSNGRRTTFKQEFLSAEDIAWLKKNARPPAGSDGGGNEIPDVLPDPDGGAPDTSKPVKVYFLSGQSNMVGMGKQATLRPLATGDEGQGYEMAGFFWWQGHKDRGMSKEEYEELLVELIRDLRSDFDAPEDTPFVTATVAFNGSNLGPWKGVFEAQMAVGDPKQHPEFAGNVASVDIRDIGGGGFHYGDNGATYAKVGDRMGRAMAKLLQGK